MKQKLYQQKSAPQGTQSVIRVISLLKAFDTQNTELSLTELGNKVGLAKTTVHRMLSALLNEGMLERDESSGRYRLGAGILMLAASIPGENNLIRLARPLLQQLVKETFETATLEVMVDNEVVLLDEVGSGYLISSNTEIGTHWPLHATATGKIYLSFVDELKATFEHPLPALASRTITDIDELLRQTVRIRRLGYASTYNELQEGFAAVAAPLLTRTGVIRGVICIGGPTQRMPRARLAGLGEQVKRIAQGFGGN